MQVESTAGLAMWTQLARSRDPGSTGGEVLFVDVHGTGWSAFLARLFAAEFADAGATRLRFASAGTHAEPGAFTPERMRRRASTFGVDLRAARATRLSEGQVSSALTVLCSTDARRDYVLAIHPASVGRVFTLEEFSAATSELESPSRAKGPVQRWRALARRADSRREAMQSASVSAIPRRADGGGRAVKGRISLDDRAVREAIVVLEAVLR